MNEELRQIVNSAIEGVIPYCRFDIEGNPEMVIPIAEKVCIKLVNANFRIEGKGGYLAQIKNDPLEKDDRTHGIILRI